MRNGRQSAFNSDHNSGWLLCETNTCSVFQHHKIDLNSVLLRSEDWKRATEAKAGTRNQLGRASAVKRCRSSDGSCRRCGQLNAVGDERELCETERPIERGRGERQTEKCSKDRVGHDGSRKVIFSDLQTISQIFQFCRDGFTDGFRARFLAW